MKLVNFRSSLALVLVALALSSCTASAPPQASPFASGGLGLTKGQWEQQHKAVTEPRHSGGVGYDGGKYYVIFWSDQPPSQTADSPISFIAVNTGQAVNAALARQIVPALLPEDVQFQRSETPGDRLGTTDYYFSPALATRYPAIGVVGSPWQTLPVGTIKVTYGAGMLPARLQPILITAGEMGIPPTAQPSEENVPSTSTWVPPALRTVVPPLPVLTGPPLPVPTGPAVPRP